MFVVFFWFHSNTTRNTEESSGWHHRSKTQHYEKRRTQIHMTDRRTSHVAAVLSSLTLKFPVKHLQMLCQPQSPLLSENRSVPPLLQRSRTKRRKRAHEGLEPRSEPSEAHAFVCVSICLQIIWRRYQTYGLRAILGPDTGFFWSTRWFWIYYLYKVEKVAAIFQVKKLLL